MQGGRYSGLFMGDGYLNALTLLEALRCRDAETESHSRRVAMIAVRLAVIAGREPAGAHYRERNIPTLTRDEADGMVLDSMQVKNRRPQIEELTTLDVRRLFLAGLLHDIGKISWPDALFTVNRPLTPEELQTVRAHVGESLTVLSQFPFWQDILPIVAGHHERWDGGGYPRGAKGKDIPYFARILCLADSYDAMRSNRCYKAGMSHDDAIEQIYLGGNAQFDPRLVAIFCKISESEWNALPLY